MRICSGAGCLRAVPDDVRFCDECKPPVVKGDAELREHSVPDRIRYAALYSGTRWQRVQAIAKRRHPFCQRCDTALTELIDHIVPSGVAVQQVRESGRFPLDKNAGFYLMSNLQGLCRRCHYYKTLEDKTHSGGWPDVLAKEERTPKKVWTF